VIILALGVGGILAGIVGVFLAVPVAGGISVILSYARREPPPESPVTDEPPGKDGMCRAVVPAQVGPPQLKRARCAQVVNRGA